MDVVLIDHNLTVGQASQRQEHTGIFKFVTMDLSMTVLCAQNFQGADCAQCVQPGSDCDDCVGVNCSGNGWCVDGNNSISCTCNPGYTGDRCQINIDDCVGVNCSGNGQCVDGINNFICECMTGYSGPLCAEGWFNNYYY